MNHHHDHQHQQEPHLRYTGVGVEPDGVGVGVRYAIGGPGSSTYYDAHGHQHHHHQGPPPPPPPVVVTGLYETDALLHRHQPMADGRNRSMIIADYFAQSGDVSMAATDAVGDWSYDIGLHHHHHHSHHPNHHQQHHHHHLLNDNCQCPTETVDDYLVNSAGSDSVFESDTQNNRPIASVSQPAQQPALMTMKTTTTKTTKTKTTMSMTLTPETVGICPLPVVRTVKRRYTANRKERRRTLSINNAFADLRDCIPNVPADTKLSKIKTLRLATSYIAYLMDILAKDDPSLVVDGEGFKAEVNKKIETREEKKKREMASLSGAIIGNGGGGGGGNTEKRGKGRTGWPQHVWALELKQ